MQLGSLIEYQGGDAVIALLSDLVQ